MCAVPEYRIDKVADHALAFVLPVTHNLEANAVNGVIGLAA
jgi:hypothetical protein